METIKKLWDELKGFVKIVFSLFMEEDGKLSMTRISIAAVLCAYIHWGTIIVRAGNDIPDLPYALAAFLAGLYNINKGGTINIGGKNNGSNDQG